MIRYRVRAIVLAGVVCVFAVCASPARAQSAKVEETAVEKVQSANSSDPKTAITTKDPNIPLEELKLLVKPLTLPELQTESSAWLLLLKEKVQQISDAEIAIKRQNQSIGKQKEAAEALEQAKSALEAAESAQAGANPGSPEYQEATKKVEEAKENLKKAQSAIEEVKSTKKELQQDEALSDALDKAKDAGELEKAKQALEKAKQERENITAGSLAYDEATKKIDTLEAAIKTFESAQSAQKTATPDSPEYEKATQELEAAEESLKKARSAIEGTGKTETESSQQSSQNLDKAANIVAETEISSSGDTKIASSVEVINKKESLQQKEKKLEKAAEQLEKNADVDSKLKNQLVVNVTELQSERTAIVDRFKVVLDELELKGGDPKSYKQYIEAINTVEIDLKDADGIGVRFVSWLQSGEGGLRWAGNLAKFVGIVVASIIVSQIFAIFLNRFLAKFDNISALLRQFTIMLVKRGGVVVGFMLALTALEISLGPILALLGGASFVLAFALQSNLGNLASGLMMMVYKPFDVGDEVKLSGIWGYVDSITLASTKIQGFQGQIFNIPNSVVWSGMIETLTQGKNRKVSIWLRIPFSEDLERVEQLLIEIIKSHAKVLQDPPPSTSVWQIEEYYISVGIGAWAKNEDYWGVHSDAIRMIRERFTKEGIPLAAIPVQEEIIIQGASSKIPQATSDRIRNSLAPEISSGA
ncbi:MAG: mechanosensitive ion channel [Calothrix sp. MO_192.B10]|nr:mechanosensitive ion channel [Calothrix sp. MO_192.B10]